MDKYKLLVLVILAGTLGYLVLYIAYMTASDRVSYDQLVVPRTSARSSSINPFQFASERAHYSPPKDDCIYDQLKVTKYLNHSIENDLALLDVYPLAVNLTRTVDCIRRGLNVRAQPVNFHPFSYMTKTACSEKEIVNMVYLIKSRPNATDRRRAIRGTWGNDALNRALRVRRVFALGRSRDEAANSDILAEQEKFGDLVQEDFEDIYRHTAIKTTMSFRWAVTYCPQAKFLIFLDDDVLVHPRNLARLLRSKEVRNADRLYMGLIKYNDPVERSGRWDIPIRQYPFKEYPPYPPAGTIITNMEFAVQFSIAFQYVQYLPLDDVFLAVVAGKLGVTPKHTDLVLYKKDVEEEPRFVTSLGEYNTTYLEAIWRGLTL